MKTNELIREFIEWNNRLEPTRNKISTARGDIFLKYCRHEFKNSDIPIVSNKEAEVCPECGYPTFKRTFNNKTYCHGCNWTKTN